MCMGSVNMNDTNVNTDTTEGYFYQVEQLTFLWILLFLIGTAGVIWPQQD